VTVIGGKVGHVSLPPVASLELWLRRSTAVSLIAAIAVDDFKVY
jgi:hypothetical protein